MNGFGGAVEQRTLQGALNQIRDPTVADAKTQFEQLINEGKAASEAFIRSSAARLEQWTIDLSNQKISQDEFDNLVSSQMIVAKNFVASQALAAQERAEKLTVKTAELAATKIVPLLMAAI
jgi:hypothetical protein